MLDRIEDPLIAALYQYWLRKSAGRPMPEKRDLDPTDIPALLPHIILWDVLPEGGFRCRLAGTHIVEVHGRELKGMTAAELHGAANQEIEDEYNLVARTLVPHYVERSMYWYHRDYKRYKRLLMPLGVNGTCSILLSIAVYAA